MDISKSMLLAASGVLLVTLLVSLLVLAYRKNKLNWFEKNSTESSERTVLRRKAYGPVKSSTSLKGGVQLHYAENNNVKCSLNRIAEEDDEFGNSNVSKKNVVAAQKNKEDVPMEPLSANDKQVVLSTPPPKPATVSSMQTKLDHTKINTNLYKKQESKSPISPEDVCGAVQFALSYDSNAGILTVNLLKAKNLRPREYSDTTDPYAKVRLLPDRNNTLQTKIFKKTLVPEFNQVFNFEVKPIEVSRKTLEILLFDFDTFSRHRCIGALQLPLLSVDLTEKKVLWQAIMPCLGRDAKEELGELLVSLQYLPSAERLTIVVIKARNLRIVDDTRVASDPFVKVSLFHSGRRYNKKKKTHILRGSVNPVFNEAFVYDVNRELLKGTSIELVVYHDNMIGQNEMLGRVVIGPKCEKQFFNEMLTNKTAVAQWLTLSDGKE